MHKTEISFPMYILAGNVLLAVAGMYFAWSASNSLKTIADHAACCHSHHCCEHTCTTDHCTTK